MQIHHPHLYKFTSDRSSMSSTPPCSTKFSNSTSYITEIKSTKWHMQCRHIYSKPLLKMNPIGITFTCNEALNFKVLTLKYLWIVFKPFQTKVYYLFCVSLMCKKHQKWHNKHIYTPSNFMLIIIYSS